jgi:acyl transferase domain-containing protein
VNGDSVSPSENGGGVETHENKLSKPPKLFVLSSYDQDGVFRVRDAYNEYLTARSNNVVDSSEVQFFRDLNFTLTAKRTRHAWRSFSIANSEQVLQKSLSELPKAVRAKSEPRLAFIFTGQGAQWPTMGIELMIFPAFQQSLLAADRYLNNLGCQWSLICK